MLAHWPGAFTFRKLNSQIKTKAYFRYLRNISNYQNSHCKILIPKTACIYNLSSHVQILKSLIHYSALVTLLWLQSKTIHFLPPKYSDPRVGGDLNANGLDHPQKAALRNQSK